VAGTRKPAYFSRICDDFTPNVLVRDVQLALSRDIWAVLAETRDEALARWRALDRGWQATVLGLALVCCVHLLA